MWSNSQSAFSIQSKHVIFIWQPYSTVVSRRCARWLAGCICCPWTDHSPLNRPWNNRISPTSSRPVSNCDRLPTRWRPAGVRHRRHMIRLADSVDRTLGSRRQLIAFPTPPPPPTSAAAYVTSSYVGVKDVAVVCSWSHDIITSCSSCTTIVAGQPAPTNNRLSINVQYLFNDHVLSTRQLVTTFGQGQLL